MFNTYPSQNLEDEVAEEKYFEPVIINAALNSKKKSKTGFTPDRWRPRPIREMDLTIMVPPNQTLDDLLEEVRRDAAEKSTPTDDGAGISADMFFSASGSKGAAASTSASVDFRSPSTSFFEESVGNEEVIAGPSGTFHIQEQQPPPQVQVTDRSFGFSGMTNNQIVSIKKKSTTKKPQPPVDTNQIPIPEEEIEDYGIVGRLGMFIRHLWGW
ncbi:5613_t:CDS:2 [Ambispora gerdemannii]|uniref:5613_t:CDS:1 n=1 Tax=Ambispora gerdemannii TaxID=144530 RepID=A0A9N9EWV7_9GLOM|nr:5613_t:CDS:2 [Ambispora gerdemannii]